MLVCNYCHGQNISDDDNTLDIEEIILNYRDKKISHFAIFHEVTSNGKRVGKVEKTYFTIENDSLLIKRYNKRKRGGVKYIIRKNEFYYIPAPSKRKEKDVKYNPGESKYNPNESRYIKKELDSANVHYTRHYRIYYQDTFLTFQWKIMKDSLNRVIEDLRQYSKTRGGSFNKNVIPKDEYFKISYSGDTVIYSTFTKYENSWVLQFTSSYMKTVSVQDTDSSHEVVTKHSEKHTYYRSFPHLPYVSSNIYTETRKVIYDDKFVKRKIISKIQRLDQEEAEILNAIKVTK